MSARPQGASGRRRSTVQGILPLFTFNSERPSSRRSSGGHVRHSSKRPSSSGPLDHTVSRKWTSGPQETLIKWTSGPHSLTPVDPWAASTRRFTSHRRRPRLRRLWCHRVWLVKVPWSSLRRSPAARSLGQQNLQICTPCDKKGSVPISTRADIGQISARYESEKADNEHRT